MHTKDFEKHMCFPLTPPISIMLLRCSLQQLHGTFDFNGINPLTSKSVAPFHKMRNVTN